MRILPKLWAVKLCFLILTYSSSLTDGSVVVFYNIPAVLVSLTEIKGWQYNDDCFVSKDCVAGVLFGDRPNSIVQLISCPGSGGFLDCPLGAEISVNAREFKAGMAVSREEDHRAARIQCRLS